MSKNTADYPVSVWDGDSPSRLADDSLDRAPDFEDWDQIVAEMIAAQTEIDAIKTQRTAENTLTLANGSGGAVVVGSAVYLLANGTGWQKADANGTAPARSVVGLVSVGASGSGGTCTVVEEGDLTLTTAQWDAVAGTTGGLTAATEYYLSGTAGAITATVPGTTGDTDIVVGIAKSTTVMHVRVRHILSSHA